MRKPRVQVKEIADRKRPVEEEEEDDFPLINDGALPDSDSEREESVVSSDEDSLLGSDEDDDQDEDSLGEWSQVSTDDDESIDGTADERPDLSPRTKYLAPSDSEDDFETPATTIGNVPIEWYEDYPHIGYDLNGKRVVKPATKDELDALLARMDDPKYLATFKDPVTHQDVTLTNEELEIVKKLHMGQYPDADYDPYPEFHEPFVSKTMTEPLTAAPEPKRRFIRSKWEHGKIMKIVSAIRRGLIVPNRPKPAATRFYNIWNDDLDKEREAHPTHIPAPKLKLPDHDESYNPPEEYLPTEEERQRWQEADEEDRETDYLPQKFGSFRKIRGYAKFINDRFSRCLDLYLCPRAQRKRVIDPDALLPKLPDLKDLEPFPKHLAITYTGHEGRVRCFSIDPTGQWIVSGSDDSSVRLWELSTGKCIQTWKLDAVVKSIAWNPNKSLCLFAVASGNQLLVINPAVATDAIVEATDELIRVKDASADTDSEQKPSSIKWIRTPTSSQEYQKGHRIRLQHTHEITQIAWHRKGDYFSTVCPQAGSNAVQIHQLTKQLSQNPFSRSKGAIQKVLFHPTKPLFFVATQRFVRVYNLQRQELVKKLQSGAKWISSLDIHPQGDNVIVGTYDKKALWFDLDLGSMPYQTLRSHEYAIRNVCFHKRFPLFASCSDDGSIQLLHGMVYNDYMQNALIVPLRKLQCHQRASNGLGVLHCEFHPVQPWIVSCGADGTLKLFS